MQQTVIGFFHSAGDAHNAAERLRANGFSEQDIDISTRHAEQYSTDSASRVGTDTHDQNTPYNVTDESRYNEPRTHDTLNEDRIRERRDDNQGFGDSIGRFFRGLFDNEEDAERYSAVGRRRAIVSVYTESSEQAERARDILDDCGAVDIDNERNEFTTSSMTDDRDIDRTSDLDRTADLDRTTDMDRRNTLSPDGVTDQSIPVIEENLNVGKREIETGGVRLRSRIFERPVEENLRLREEHVRVERVPVNRPATEADFDTFREGEIEMTETTEVPVVNKEARVVEEVRLTKDVDQREEVVRDTVRQTDVDVEKMSEETLKSKRTRKKL
jgi:stress response protein YsnF